MNLGDVKTRVKRQFGDESGVQVTDDDITRWVNDGIQYIVANNEGLLEKTSTINVVANQQDYSLPSDLLVLRSIHYKANPDAQSYFHLMGYDLQKFDSYVDGWDGTFYGPGPTYVYTIFADLLRLFPIPDLDVTDGIKFFYNRTPSVLLNADDASELDLPRNYHKGVVDYCLQQAYELDENFDSYDRKGLDVQNVMKINRHNSPGAPAKEFYPTITPLPEDAW